jgi:hypothetical protein
VAPGLLPSPQATLSAAATTRTHAGLNAKRMLEGYGRGTPL